MVRVMALTRLSKSEQEMFQIEKEAGFISPTCEQASVTVVTWHDLRHTFASHLVAKSAPLPAVQKLLGHSEIKMTMRYSHLGPDQLRDAVALLAPTSKDEMSTQRQPENPHIKNPAQWLDF